MQSELWHQDAQPPPLEGMLDGGCPTPEQKPQPLHAWKLQSKLW